MIIVEDRFDEMFNVLPGMKYKQTDDVSYKPVFGFGDEKELNLFLQNSSSRPYPLIWLLYPFKERHFKNQVELKKVVLILACETIAGKDNEQRFNDIFKPILFPLLNYVNELFEKSNIIKMDKYYDIIKFPNYNVLNVLRTKEENQTIDIWDAIKMEFDCTINGICFRKNIVFKNNN